MNPRERRQAIQQHLAEQRAKGERYLSDRERVHEGFRSAVAYSDTLMAAVCLTCGAVVARDSQELHVEWHGEQG